MRSDQKIGEVKSPFCLSRRLAAFLQVVCWFLQHRKGNSPDPHIKSGITCSKQNELILQQMHWLFNSQLNFSKEKCFQSPIIKPNFLLQSSRRSRSKSLNPNTLTPLQLIIIQRMHLSNAIQPCTARSSYRGQRNRCRRRRRSRHWRRLIERRERQRRAHCLERRWPSRVSR